VIARCQPRGIIGPASSASRWAGRGSSKEEKEEKKTTKIRRAPRSSPNENLSLLQGHDLREEEEGFHRQRSGNWAGIGLVNISNPPF